MLIGLSIRDVVLVECLDLAFGRGLTALTGETGAGKSIILDALGLATGARGDAALVRRGAAQAVATAVFAPARDDGVWDWLDDKGLTYNRDEDLVLRRVLGADGRSRAFVNDQATGVGALKDLGDQLIEVHGQHETVGLLDARTHRALLDGFGDAGGDVAACGTAWRDWRAARETVETLAAGQDRAAAQIEELSAQLAELDRLAPLHDEATALALERAVLGSAEKTLADIQASRDHLAGDAMASRLAQALRSLDRARERTLAAGADAAGPITGLIAAAAEAVDRAAIEAAEAAAAVDAAARALDFEPDHLEKTEERLFALRAAARKLGVDADALPAARAAVAARLSAIETADEDLAAARVREDLAQRAYREAAGVLTATRMAAADRLVRAVHRELAPLKLDKARFAVVVEPLPEDRCGAFGVDRVELQIATLPGAPFGALGAIASGGELARFALALKASLASRGTGPQPLMIFDEVDQGVGGAVADAVGLRLKRLAVRAQVLAVTHSPQVAARADAHWRVRKIGEGEAIRAAVDTLGPHEREEEIARMLSGATVTDAARAAARALMHV